MLRRLIGEDILLEIRLAPTLAPVRADESQLTQVVMNLAVNARDAMAHGGTLAIETENGADARSVLLRVRDTGVGMDAATLAHVFEPFYTTKGGVLGTGLGLATVFGIVQQSGGELTVESEPGRGACFEISLPAATAAAREEAAPAEPASSLRGSETILLVEDDPSVRAAVRRILERYGYDVVEASDGATALAVCGGRKPPVNLVVTDVVMPGMNGVELVERIHRLHPDLPALYVSGYVDSSVAGRLDTGESLTLLQKPFSADTLARKVREALAGS
jgi:two-component system, cell cycle sensor histidine kinase and response regulator CckA